MYRRCSIGFISGLMAFAMIGIRPTEAAPLTIGYSDWPGWVAWQVAIDKGWLKEAGLDVKFQWFDYSASMDAFAAGKIDADLMTNGDTLVTGAGGGKGIMIMLTDYSERQRHDRRPSPASRASRISRARRSASRSAWSSICCCCKGLKKHGMSEKDVTLVNAKTNETPQVLASGQVDAIGAWQPYRRAGDEGVCPARGRSTLRRRRPA